MANVETYDVIICGAGPAGSTCALALADSGLKVAVIEKSFYPRDKICGDAVAAYVPKVLNTIHPKFKEALLGFDEKVIVNTCRIVAPNKKAIDFSYPENGFIARRMNWDNFLYELASAQKNIRFFLGHAVTDVIRDHEKNTIQVTANNIQFEANMVIGCDGAHSIVNKKLAGTKVDLNHHSGAVRAYYKNVTGIPDKTFELHFIKGLLPGYFWIFPVKDNMANVGLGALSSAISQRKMNLRTIFQHTISHEPSIRERFRHAEVVGKIEGFGLPLGSRKVTMSGDNFMLCGDAASLIDPLSGEGIGQAMVSGRYAGWHAKKCFDTNNFSAAFMKEYDQQVYHKFWSRHSKNYFLQRVIANREWLFNSAVSATLKSALLKKMVVKAMV